MRGWANKTLVGRATACLLFLLWSMDLAARPRLPLSGLASFRGWHRYRAQLGKILRPFWMTPRFWSARVGAGNGRTFTITKSNETSSLLFSDGLLNVRSPEWTPAEGVRPRFREFWSANVSYRWRMDAIRWHPALKASLGFSDNAFWGYELGLESEVLSFSFFDEAAYPGVATGGSRYLAQLVQVEAKYPAGRFTPYVGIKSHWRSGDLWSRAGIRIALESHTQIDVGADLFTGPAGTYFGDWGSRRRAYAVLSVDL